MYVEDIRKTLYELQDLKYKEFHSSLCPNVDNIIGVRIPDLRNIAKEIAKNDYKKFLRNAKDEYYEELVLHGLVIGYAKITIEETIEYLKEFIPKIDSWAACDTTCSNLKVTKKLEKLLNTFGFNVVLTRTNADGLYSQLATNKKQDDMKKRKEIIQKSKPNMVVSIHMNSFPNKHERGAQVFYQVGEETSKQLAQTIQNEMIKNLVEAREFCNHSDLYILQCTQNPSVVVEGGFLSNPEEEALLITDEYQEKLAYSVFCGILKFFEKQNAA